MLYNLLFILYLVLCLAVAFLGRRSRVGYWGTFLFSLIITPFLMFLILILMGDRPRESDAGGKS